MTIESILEIDIKNIFVRILNKLNIGNQFSDNRGVITYNNQFDASEVKRIYTIENNSNYKIRGWQGHKIEQRWFAAMRGRFIIYLIQLDDFDSPSKDLPIEEYILDDQKLTFLHVLPGCISAIRALTANSKLLVLADHNLNEVNDELRYNLDYFNKFAI